MADRVDGKPKKFTRQGYMNLEECAGHLERENAQLRLILNSFLGGLAKLIENAEKRSGHLNHANPS